MSATSAEAAATTASPRSGVDEDLVLDLLGLLSILALAFGVAALASSDAIGFDRASAIAGVLRELPATIPAAIAVLAVVALEIAAGAVLVALAFGRPAIDLPDLLLTGLVGAVVKDVALLGTLGQVGLFDQPILLAVDAALVAGAFVAARARAFPARTALAIDVRLSPLVLLVVIVGAGAVLLQLASPVVPFIDVLPNHVAPAEHLRTFGGLTPLTATQSPIYGPSRSFLGYTALLGAVTTMTGLPAGLAISAFILPLLLLLVAGVARFARAVAGPVAVTWSVLAFSLSGPFGRMTDARATVVVIPLVAWGLTLVAAHMAAPAAPGAEMPPAGDPSRGIDPATGDADLARRVRRPLLPESVVLGIGLGAAVLVHPVVGALAVATVLALALAKPAEIASLALPAVASAAVVALPQAATMVGIGLPSVALVVALAAAITVGIAVDRVRDLHGPLVTLGRLVAVAAGIAIVVAAAPVVRAFVTGVGALVIEMELSVVALAIGLLIAVPGARARVVVAGLVVGMIVATVTQLIPADDGAMLAQSIRYELPKTLHYWFPIVLAVGAGASLAGVWARRSIPLVIRAGVVGAFLVVAAVPLRPIPIDAQHIGEHRFAESLAIDLRFAGRGYWNGYPDARLVVDPPRQAILDALRKEIAAGRLRADTPVLHVATSFQQWIATPLGVFAGVTETDVTPDAELNIHTVGGRLRPMTELPRLLADPAFAYVVLEPGDGLPASTRTDVTAAGYTPIFANGQGEVFAIRR